MDDGEVFDVNEYLDVLTHLSVQQGYVLDYVYFSTGMGGEPILYTRPETDPRPQTFAEFKEATGTTLDSESRHDYLSRIQMDGTPEGFFEWIVLRVMGGQFYLFWHANYNDVEVICNSARIKEIVSDLRTCQGRDEDYCMTRKEKREAQEIAVQPVVEYGADTVTVRVVTFSDWSGFVQRTYTVRKSFPHEILGDSVTVLVPYDCGIQF
jgi:hypothetical protein